MTTPMPLLIQPSDGQVKVPAVVNIDACSVDTNFDDDQSSTTSRSHRASLSSCSSVDDGKTPVATEQKPFDKTPSIGPTFNECMATDWSVEKEKTVTEPYEYVCSLGGKGFRKQIIAALNVWLKLDDETVATIDKAVAMLHNASLMIDDIQDGSKFRRGSLSTHQVYGVASTINSANLIYFQAQNEIRKLRNMPEAFTIFNEELINLHRGQGMELYWRDNLLPPTEADYLQMIANKTGGLFRLVLKLMQSQSDFARDLTPLIDSIGLVFQIIDDYLNLKDDTMRDQKGYCEDLTEGKFSYPVSFAIWNKAPQTNAILAVLKARSEDLDTKAWVVSYLEKEGVFEQVRLRVENSYQQIQQMLADIPERNPMLEKLVEMLIAKMRA